MRICRDDIALARRVHGDGRDDRKVVELGLEVDESDRILLEFLSHETRQRMAPEHGDERGSSAKVMERNGGVGCGSANKDVLTLRGYFGVRCGELVDGIYHVDRRHADEYPVGRGFGHQLRPINRLL